MKPIQRQLKIAEMIRRQGEASVDALAGHFGLSTETIRRDLAQLAETGKIQKIHGGARVARLQSEGSFAERLGRESDAKTAIAETLAGIIRPGETLFIDTGSTTLAAADRLARIPGLTIITNSARLADRLCQFGSDAAIYLLGGRYHEDNAETTGPLAIAQIAAFQADHAILTVAAVDPEFGVTDASFEEAQVARAMIENARNVIILADSSKFGRRAAFSVCKCTNIGVLISDEALGWTHRELLTEAGVQVWCGNER